MPLVTPPLQGFPSTPQTAALTTMPLQIHGNWLKEWSVSAAAFPLVMLDLDATTKPFTEVIY